MSDNLLAPLEFEDADVDRFIRDHRCVYGCKLDIRPIKGTRKWTVNCQTHGPIMAHNFVKVGIIEHNEQGRMWAERDLRPDRPKRTPEEILKELGF
jgi:hypothetical protein